MRDTDVVHLRDVWNLLVRNWGLILFSIFLGVVGTGAYVYFTVPVYRATTSIRIEEGRTELPVLDILQTLSTGSGVETEMEVLRARTLAESVVDSLGLQVTVISPRGASRAEILRDVQVEASASAGRYRLTRGGEGTFTVRDDVSGAGMGTVSSSVAVALPGVTFRLTDPAPDVGEIVIEVRSFEESVEQLRERLSVGRPNRDAGIITVTHESTDTFLVHEVPNALAAKFIAQGRRVRKTEATSTVRFLEQQIDTLSEQLRLAEEALTAFRTGEQVVSLQAEAESQVTQLTRLQAERNILETERSALQQLVDEFQTATETADPAAPSPFNRLISFPTLYRNQATSELMRSLSDANAERSELLERRTMEDPDVRTVTDRIHAIEDQLRATVVTYLEGLTNQVAAYDQTLARFGTELGGIPAKELRLTRLQRQTTVLEDVYTLLQSRLQEARVLEAVEDASVRVVDPAILPREPVRPHRLLAVFLGLVVGTMLGIGLAALRDYLDDTVHTREDVVEASRGRPMLGLIPRIRQATPGGRVQRARMLPGELGEHLIAGRDPRSPVSEAYRTLRTNLTFSNPDRPPKTIVFTSPLPRDGKSTSAANLAITMSQQGIRTLLIDADLRRGMLNSVFGHSREPGLTNLLGGSAELSEAIREIDLGESGTLHFLPSGPFPPNPAEILGSQKMRSLLEAVEKQYELILIDCTPLTVVTDAAVLGTKADGVVLVARANVTEKAALAYAVEQLETIRAPILGCVLNDVDFRRDSRYSGSWGKYGFYYQYYYADDGGRRRTRA
jgi:tyrosine-protein kinase Etk/Wzc